MTRYGYARVSSRRQDVRDQVAQLRAVGVDDIRTETGSGAGNQPVLDQLLTEPEPGDVLGVTALDRLTVGRQLVDDGANIAAARTIDVSRSTLSRHLVA